jgi:ribokinase
LDVIGVGDADIDIYLQVDHIPGRDEKLLAQSVDLYPGGMVANFLAALSRLGTSCAFNGPVGDDEFGRLTLGDLVANGVDVSAAVVKPGERTYFCNVMLDESGEKALIVAPTSCLSPLPEDVSKDALSRARHLHTTAAQIETAEKAIRLARQNGMSVSLDLEPSAVRADNRGRLLELFTHVDLLFVNQRAVNLLCNGQSPERAAEALVAHGTRVVCLTRGKDGSATTSTEGTFTTKAFPVTVVDSTGAGDCFAAGFVHGFLRGWSLSLTAIFASAVGALSVTHYGGHGGAPTFAQVSDWLKRRSVQLPPS